jgi:hypothetical protein
MAWNGWFGNLCLDSSGTVSDYINNMGGRGETYDEFIKRIKGNSDENKN